MQNATIVVVCRRASDALCAGCERGYFCRACGLEVQVSPDGRRQIASGGTPYCNPCGLKLVEKHAKAGTIEHVIENPLAKAALDKLDADDILGRRRAKPPADDLSKTMYTHGPTRLEVLPSGKLNAFETLGVNSPDRPLWRICDCCLSKIDRSWLWRHRGFGGWWPPHWHMRRVDYQAGYWGFCVYCKALWEARDMRTLAARVYSLNSDNLHVDVLERLYSILPEVIYGEPQEWHSGQRVPEATTERTAS